MNRLYTFELVMPQAVNLWYNEQEIETLSCICLQDYTQPA